MIDGRLHAIGEATNALNAALNTFDEALYLDAKTRLLSLYREFCNDQELKTIKGQLAGAWTDAAKRHRKGKFKEFS